jgi:hypothetical protein
MRAINAAMIGRVLATWLLAGCAKPGGHEASESSPSSVARTSPPTGQRWHNS